MKIIRLLLLITFFTLPRWCCAYDFSAVTNGQTLYYNILSDSTVEVCAPFPNGWGSFSQPTGKLIIPSHIQYNGIEYPVSGIGAKAFRNCSGIDTLIVSDNVTYIYYDAFSYCTSLGMVELPLSLNFIGVRAFANCINLRKIIYTPASVVVEDDGGYSQRTFEGCPLDTIVFGSQVQTIERVLFRNISPHVITILNPVPPSPIGNGQFFALSAVSIVNIPCGTINVYINHAYWANLSNVFFQMCDGLAIADVLPISDYMGCVQGAGVYPLGDTATFTAIPKCGFGLASWSDGCIDNPRQIRMDADTTVTATFVPVNGFVHDTVLLPDTISFIDTVIYSDTLYFFDTTSVYLYDTISVYDSITIFDTVVLFDTIWVYDTIMVYDTITIYDTVHVSIDEIDVDLCSWSVIAEGEFITVRGACGETVQVFDALGRRLHIQQNVPDAVRFHMPSSSTYLIRVGNWPARKVTLIK